MRDRQKKVSKATKKDRLSYVGDFIRATRDGLAEGELSEEGGFWIYRRDEGSLFFDRPEARAYRALITRLSQDFVKGDDLSRRSVEHFLQDALFQALDLQKCSDVGFDERLARGLDELNHRLSRQPELYSCFVPVEGFEPKELPIHFGDFRFVLFGESHCRLLQRTNPTVGTNGPARTSLLALLREREMLWHKPCAVVRVLARDFESAQIRARRQTSAILDTLNFFVDLIPYNHGWLYLPGESAKAIEVMPIVQADHGVSIRQSVVGPPLPFSFANLRKAKALQPALRAISQLWRARNVERVHPLLTSVGWAGRATVETKREKQFLLYSIALESVVLPEGETHELVYRLSLRTARLLGRTRIDRAEIATTVRKLYKIRSRIVHSGSYEVTDEDLGRLTALVKRVLIHLLKSRRTRSFSAGELGEWLEGSVLS